MGLKVILWEQKPRSDGSCIIKIYLNRDKHTYYSLKGLSCLPKEFDWKAGRVKTTRQNWQHINTEIKKAYDRFERIMLENPLLPVNEIINIYNKTDSSSHTLFSFIELFIGECKSGKIRRSVARQKHYNTTYNKLIEFNPRLDFKDINKNFYDSFVTHLRKTLAENSAGLHINVLKAFLNEANERNIYSGIEHKKKYFKAPSAETESIYLNEKEINKIVNLKLSGKNKHLQAERDRFIVSYFFLLRYSDSIRLEKEMLFNDNGNMFVRLRAQKTNGEIVLPVKPIVQKILEQNNYNLNFDTNQESNWKLKEIARLSKIDKSKIDKISTHTARRSGATNLFLAGVPEKTIMDLGGWKKVDTFRKYIRVSKLETALKMADHPFFK